MHNTDSERLATKARAIEDALSRIGEPITEAQAKSVRNSKTASARTACSRWLQAGGSSCPVRG